MKVTFPSGALELEGALTLPPACRGAAVICHPHPQYGGDMDNLVVLAVAQGLQEAGVATLRFNFRGVGRSTGSYGNGVGEAEDAGAAVRYVIERSGVASATLAGYSFGAMVALQAGARLAEVERLIAIAPPLMFFDLGRLADCTKPKLLVVGDRDQYCRVAVFSEQVGRLPDPKTPLILPGADHFFASHGASIADAVRAFIATP